MSEQQKQLQSLSDEFQSLQTELQTTVSARQKLESQQQENLGVQKEFATLSDDANVYKLVGPVLLKQDTSEARSTVDGRLEFIEKEIKRIETQIASVQEKSEQKKMEIYQLQTQMQQPQGQAQPA
ncbi:Prefoldin [Cryomyces antarcticus]